MNTPGRTSIRVGIELKVALAVARVPHSAARAVHPNLRIQSPVYAQMTAPTRARPAPHIWRP
eukprot:12275422-Karenia_brevis.AAC.1